MDLLKIKASTPEQARIEAEERIRGLLDRVSSLRFAVSMAIDRYVDSRDSRNLDTAKKSVVRLCVVADDLRYMLHDLSAPGEAEPSTH